MVSSTYESIFSYNLTRPYPFRWFTPVVFVGTLAATALFSFVNIATTGYEMVTVETADPNTTIAHGTYFSEWPSYLTAKTRPSCESKTLAINNAYYTNNTAFAYRLESIGQSQGRTQLGDMLYMNNRLQNCTIPSIKTIYEATQRSALQIARQQWGASLMADVNCVVENAQGALMINMTTRYDLNDEDGPARFPGRNETSKASLWWGESLLAWYYLKITRDIQKAVEDPDERGKRPTYKGFAEFFPPNTTPGSEDHRWAQSWQAARRPGCYFVPFSNNGTVVEVLFCEDGRLAYPSIWPSAETMAKSLYATIMADLGQGGVNIVSDPDLLRDFTSNFTVIQALQAGGRETWGWGNNLKHKTAFPDLAAGPYTTSNASNWELGVHPSVISVTYLCQVPRLKSTGSLFFSVLVANLVLLQALWKIFVLVVDFFAARKHPEMKDYQDYRPSRGLDED